MQANAFGLSTKILGLAEFTENDFLSNAPMPTINFKVDNQSLVLCMEKMERWLNDTIFIFEKDYGRSSEVLSHYDHGKGEAYDAIMSKLYPLKNILSR